MLYPFSPAGAAISPSVAFDQVSQSFHSALYAGLMGYGLNVQTPTSSSLPDGALFVTGQVVKADPGSQLMRWLFTFFAGGANFQALGIVGDATVSYAQFPAAGTRRAGAFGGNSVTLMNDAARLAGQQAAQNIVAILAARP